MPLDPDPVRGGNVMIAHHDGKLYATVVRASDGTGSRVAHFVTCPNRDQHRRSGPGARGGRNPANPATAGSGSAQLSLLDE